MNFTLETTIDSTEVICPCAQAGTPSGSCLYCNGVGTLTELEWLSMLSASELEKLIDDIEAVLRER